MRRAAGAALLALLLAGGQLYWRKPGADLEAFTADHRDCAGKAATNVGGDRVLVNLDVYRACLKMLGWQRETGSTVGNPPGFYRGLEDEGPIRLTDLPQQVGPTEPGDSTSASASRQLVCRRTWIERPDWREHTADYRECLGR